MFRLLLVFLLVASPAFAESQTTAYDALKVVGQQFHRAALSRIISVTGVDGDPQPTRWTVLIADRNAPAGVRELQVANGRIIADRTPTDGFVGSPDATINTSRLNLDSSGAFSVASYTADKSHTNFERVAYTLRTNSRGNPVWIVTIQDQARQPIGTIHIAANKGNVTRVEGMYSGRNMASVQQDPAEPPQRQIDREGNRTQDEYEQSNLDAEADTSVAVEDEDVATDGDENLVKLEVKRMFKRTQRSALRIFEKVRRPFDDYINRR
jgi:hypothetical protein